jgi:hypothetical protein
LPPRTWTKIWQRTSAGSSMIQTVIPVFSHKVCHLSMSVYACHSDAHRVSPTLNGSSLLRGPHWSVTLSDASTWPPESLNETSIERRNFSKQRLIVYSIDCLPAYGQIGGLDVRGRPVRPAAGISMFSFWRSRMTNWRKRRNWSFCTGVPDTRYLYQDTRVLSLCAGA